jgi:hypothetical protein
MKPKCKKLIMPPNAHSMRRCSHDAGEHGYCSHHIPKELRRTDPVVLYRVPKYFIDIEDGVPHEVFALEVKERSFIDADGTKVNMESTGQIHFRTLAEAYNFSLMSLCQRRDQAKKNLERYEAGIELLINARAKVSG